MARGDRPGVLLDIDGVLVLSWQPLPGAVDAVRAVREAAVPVRFVTNTTSRSAAQIACSLRACGIDLDDAELVTAGVATADHLRRHHPCARCLVLNDAVADDLDGVELVPEDDESAEVVVVGSGGPSFTWHRLNVALRALQGGAALVAMHGSSVWRTEEGDCLDGGAYVRLLESASGVTATVIGKPAPGLFTTACASMGVDAADAVMVGDDLASDVLAAQAVGLTGVLVRTGKFRPEQLERTERQPDAVVDSIADVPGLLGLA